MTSKQIQVTVAEKRFFFEPITVTYWPRDFSDEFPGMLRIFYTYDFGMEDLYCFYPDQHNTCQVTEDMSDEEIVRKVVEFDLAHAFGHIPEDPNYTHTHWALFGNLQNRFIKEVEDEDEVF